MKIQQNGRRPFLLFLSIILICIVQFHFAFADEKDTKQLKLVSSTFIGDTETPYLEMPFADFAIDNDGNVFVTGMTSSSSFPVTPNGYDTNYNGEGDVFIAKLDKNLKKILAATFIGGSGREWGRAIKINKDGDILVSGMTSSSDFPFTESHSLGKVSETNAEINKAFVIKLGSDLTMLHAAIEAGRGDGFDLAFGMNGEIYVTGSTGSDLTDTEIPKTSDAFDLTFNSGESDAFIAKFDPNLVQLTGYTLIGGNGMDEAVSITIGTKGDVYITGQTSSNDFPTTQNTVDNEYNGGEHDVFVARFNHDLSQLKQATYVGGSNRDVPHKIMYDPTNKQLLIVGRTGSKDFPVTEKSFDSKFNGGEFDGFILALDFDMTHLLNSTYVGGTGTDRAFSIAKTKDETLVITGDTRSFDFPVTTTNTDMKFSGGSDAFIVEMHPSLQLLRASCFGGKFDEHVIVNKTHNDELWLLGVSSSNKLAVNKDAYLNKKVKNHDIFVSLFKYVEKNNSK